MNYPKVNDRVRVIDEKHAEFDQTGVVTEITVLHVFVVLDDTTPLMLRFSQVVKIG